MPRSSVSLVLGFRVRVRVGVGVRVRSVCCTFGLSKETASSASHLGNDPDIMNIRLYSPER